MAAVSWASQTIVAERWGNLALDLADRREWEVKLCADEKRGCDGQRKQWKRRRMNKEEWGNREPSPSEEGIDGWWWWLWVSEGERERGLGKIGELGFWFDVSMNGGRMDKGAGEWRTVTLIQVQTRTNGTLTHWLTSGVLTIIKS